MTPTHYTIREGGTWIPWENRYKMSITHMHSIRFADGREWDQVNGWREPMPWERRAGMR